MAKKPKTAKAKRPNWKADALRWKHDHDIQDDKVNRLLTDVKVAEREYEHAKAASAEATKRVEGLSRTIESQRGAINTLKQMLHASECEAARLRGFIDGQDAEADASAEPVEITPAKYGTPRERAMVNGSGPRPMHSIDHDIGYTDRSQGAPKHFTSF